MVTTVVLIVIYLAALCALLVVSRRKKAFYATMKGICSTLFLVCALFSWFTGQKQDVTAFWLLFMALVLCAFGDVFLGVANRTQGKVSKKPFLAGAVSFTFAHMLFCIMFYYGGALYLFDIVPPIILLCVLFLLEKLNKVRLKKMRLMGYIYTFMVALMAGKAMQLIFINNIISTKEILLSLGAALFLVSDILLLFLYFGTKRNTRARTANLTTYYIGVYLMASSANWF